MTIAHRTGWYIIEKTFVVVVKTEISDKQRQLQRCWLQQQKPIRSPHTEELASVMVNTREAFVL